MKGPIQLQCDGRNVVLTFATDEEAEAFFRRNVERVIGKAEMDRLYPTTPKQAWTAPVVTRLVAGSAEPADASTDPGEQ